MKDSPKSITALAPGKVILFGEHAINRGQPALAASVGLYARCAISKDPESDAILFRSGGREERSAPDDVLSLHRQIEQWRASENFEAIRALKAADFFAPQKYILACACCEALAAGLKFEWESEIPPSSGLGSGGSAFVAMVTALSAFLRDEKVKAKESARPMAAEIDRVNGWEESGPSLAQRADWAHRGDLVAHGGVASALDTQTSLSGGVIHYTGQGLATPVLCAAQPTVVIGHSGVGAPTSEINSRVRRWLAEKPDVRIKSFETIGALTRAARPALEGGDWDELGRLMNLNQLVLEKIGVSCLECDRLIDAALAAGALGAKISGSGGGGIVIALTLPERKQAVAAAITAAGGQVFLPEIAVPGARIVSSEDSHAWPGSGILASAATK